MSEISSFSPHSTESLRFLRDVVGMKGKWMTVLSEGLSFDFTTLPGQYTEQNNRSALENLPFVRKTVSEWVAAGHVEILSQPAWCNSPLTVVQKYDAVADKLKERLVME